VNWIEVADDCAHWHGVVYVENKPFKAYWLLDAPAG
jgi:hypothetical protein